MSIKTLSELLDDLDLSEGPVEKVSTLVEDIPPADLSPVSVKTKAFRDLPEADKCETAFAWKMRGVPVKAIAESFDVDKSTVYRWIENYVRTHRERLEQLAGADVITDSLLFYEKMEEMFLFEANLAGGGGGTIDEASGKVIRDDATQSKTLRQKLFMSAMKARESKIKLMQDTGVLPREPDRIYRRMVEESREEVEDRRSAVRSSEEVRNSIIQLLEKGRSLA